MASEHLEVVFGVKNAPLKAGIDQAMQYVSDFRKEVGTKFAGVLAFGGLVEAIKAVVEYGAEINDLSAKFGVSTGTLQRWGIAAETNASSAASMAAAFNKLIISQSKARQGDEAMIEDFAKLGVSMEDLQALDPEELMRKLADSTLEAANVTAILGRGSLELVPMLQAVSDGTADLGSAMEDETIRALGKAADDFKAFGQQAIVMGGGVLEFFRKIILGISALAGAGVENARTMAGTMVTLATASFAITRGDIAGGVRELSTVWKKVGETAVKTFNDATDALGELLMEEQAGQEQRSTAAAEEAENSSKVLRLRERIAEMQERAALEQMEKMDRIAALDAKALQLVRERDAAGRDSEAGLEKQVEIEETRLAIQRLLNEVADEGLQLAEKERKEREQVAERHEKELKDGRDKLIEEQGRLAVLREEVAGRDDVARRLERQLEFQGRIREIEEQIAAARKDGNTALAETLTKLKGVVAQQQTLANDAAREALARNGGQAPTATQLRRQRRADQRADRAAERFRGRLVDGVIPTARDINGRPIRGIDPVTGEERPIGGAPQAPDVFKNPDPRKGPEQIGPQLPPGAKPGGGDLQRPGEPGAKNPNSEVVAELKAVVVKLEEIRRKVEPPLGWG